MKQNYIFKRNNGVYYFVINVPTKMRSKFKSRQYWKSLHTTCASTASKRVASYIAEYTSLFEASDQMPDQVTYLGAKAAADRYNIDYCVSKTFLESSLTDAVNLIGQRLEILEKISQVSPVEIAALGGAVSPEQLTMGKLFERFKELSPDKISGLNDLEEKRKWRRYEEATEDFTARMPEITDVLKIEPKNVYEYRAKLIKCVNEGQFKSDVAKKKLNWIRIVFKKVLRSDYPNLKNAFEDLEKIEIRDDSKRLPFSAEEISKIEREIARSAINPAAKAILKLGQLTGCSVKELVLLEGADIKLDSKIPTIFIRPNSLRTSVKRGGARHREVPLVGEASEIMKEFPAGFTQFQDPRGPERMNRAMSDFFKKTVPGKGHYSFRHRLDDLLKNSGCDLGLKSAIMGHFVKGHSTYYGKGYDLDQKRSALEKAFLFAARADDEGSF